MLARRTTSRSGAILLVVLAMLALMAVLGLSFVLYAESEATSLRNGRQARNAEADPNPQEPSNDFLGQLVFDTYDKNSAVYGHGVATTKYGWVAGGGQSYSPYAGSGLPAEDVSGALGFAPNTLNRTGVVNYTINAAGQFVDPNILTVGGTPFNKSTPYTYPDRANFALAMQDPMTGQIIQPSFHRPDLFGSLDPSNPNWGVDLAGNPNGNVVGRYYLTRQRPAEHPKFPRVPQNPDGSYTGDVANLKYTLGAQKNDSLWMYTGSPIKTWRNKRYAALIAPIVLDLNGKVNLSVAGNNRNAGATTSNQGFGTWEQNPQLLGLDPTEFQKIVSQRYTGSNAVGAVPPARRYDTSGTATATSANINGRRLPPQYSRIDADGVGSGAADPMTVAPAGNYNPFLVFTTPRFAATQLTFYDDPPNNAPPTVGPPTGELIDHPGSFNPFHWPRGVQPLSGPHSFGMDDLVAMGRYSDPKGRYIQGHLGQIAPTSLAANTPSAMQNRALTTAFSVTQTWGEVTIATNGGVAKLGPVDLNRPLADYRINTTLTYRPDNVNPATIEAARASRQRLANDIFLRLVALANLADGTNVSYNATTNTLNPVLPTVANFAALRKLAQYAANIVDTIDNDDIVTAFVWNPVAAVADPGDAVNFLANTTTAVELGNRVVYGTELPRLVINEAYCKLDNNRIESSDSMNQPNPDPAAMMKRIAKQDLQKKYWVELHNPLPPEPATSLVSELGAARLQYVNAVSPGATATYAVYQIEIAETTAAQPLANHLTTAPGNVVGDPSQVGATLVQKLRINNFTYDPAALPPATLVGDELNVVRPTAAASGANASNQGYYVVGPRDPFVTTPAGSVASSMCLPDPIAVAAPNLPNAAIYDLVGIKNPMNASATASSSVILQRLANPYLAPQPTLTLPNYNPYITVDFLENIPTRDRAEFNDTDGQRPGFTKATEPSIGRRHPYANMPAFDPTMPDLIANSVHQQSRAAADMVTPGHSFFSTNYRATTINAGALASYTHYDRELINSLELLRVNAFAPSLLTASFSDGTAYQRHNASTPLAMSALLNVNFPAVGMGTNLFKAFDILTVANRLPGIPLGGREPGKINLNTVTDSRVLQAVLDPQQGNQFNTAYVNTTWTGSMLPTRTPNWGTAPYVRGTFDETATVGADRPYKSFGGANSAYEETFFRSAIPQPMGATYPFPGLFYPSAAPQNDPYFDEEPLRKAWNSLTTVSDGFLVIWTVGFFEVESPVGAAVPQFGREIFKDVLGDLRTQYSAVVDRSMLTVANGAPTAAGPKPWETKLAADAAIGTATITVEGKMNGANLQIFSGNEAFDVTPGTPLRLGTGDSLAAVTPGEGEWVTANSFVAAPAAGQVVITLAAGTTRFHGASTRVSNAIPGNPGPQPGFDASLPANRHIVPYFTKIDP